MHAVQNHSQREPKCQTAKRQINCHSYKNVTLTQCKFGQIQMMDSLNGYYCKKSKIPIWYYKMCY